MKNTQKVLVTGATGFIGKRLILQLLEDGHEVYALSRIRNLSIPGIHSPKLHTIYGDLSQPQGQDSFPTDIDAAYYLMHSMGSSFENLQQEEANVARKFLELLEPTQCQQIIYLSGITNHQDKLSEHLGSRLEVEHVLKSRAIPLTVLRASIIIGSGSASFEIIRDLVEKLPVMVAPRWVESRCQPIAVADVIFYLSKIMMKPEAFGRVYEIGGPEPMTFRELLLAYAKFRDLRRYIIHVPILTPRLSSYWLVFITTVRYSLCRYLVESMRYDSICHETRIRELIPHTPSSIQEAFEKAFLRISQNNIPSTWMDAWRSEPSNPNIQSYIQVPEEGCFKNRQEIKLQIPEHIVGNRVWQIGGKNGWYAYNWAWRLRGLVDQFLGGTGMNIGRRDAFEINVGDSIDFWRVVKAQKQPLHLILYAEMKLPGEAWLEFQIENGVYTQTATFRPKGLWGRVYWYLLMPIHPFIFGKMAKSICS